MDHNYIFRDIYIGWSGSVHDARVFAHSSLYKKATVGSILNGASVQIQSQDISPFLIGDCISPVTMALEAFFTQRNPVRSREEVQLYTTYQGLDSHGKYIRSVEGSLA